MSRNVRTVAMTEGSWTTLYSVVLEQVQRLREEGEPGMARQLMNGIAPALSSASSSPDLERIERQLRERLGLDPVRHAQCPEVVEDVKPMERTRRGAM